jgi:outer membrane protein assembly factor BamD
MRSLTGVALALMLAVLAACSGLEAKDETVDWNAQKLYTEAKTALGEGSYEQAIKYFEKLESRFPYGRYAQQAQLEVAYAYFKSGEQAQGVAACDRFIKLHPNHPNVDYAYYLKGLINFNEDLGFLSKLSDQDMTERDPRAANDAFESFREVVTRFPESHYAADSEQRMAYLVNALASGEVHVARYYYRRGAYLASVNRAQYVVKTYPQAPAMEEALYIMILDYDALGMQDLKADAERVMKKSFPNSKIAEAGLERKKPWWRLW